MMQANHLYGRKKCIIVLTPISKSKTKSYNHTNGSESGLWYLCDEILVKYFEQFNTWCNCVKLSHGYPIIGMQVLYVCDVTPKYPTRRRSRQIILV